MALASPNRDQVFALIEDARVKRRGKKAHVKAEVEKQFPDLVGKKIRRNGHSYDLIDYITEDVDNYG